MATANDPNGEFLTPVNTQEARLRDAQQVLLGIHAPFSDIVAKPHTFDPAAIDRIRGLIEQLDAEIRKQTGVFAAASLTRRHPSEGITRQRG